MQSYKDITKVSYQLTAKEFAKNVMQLAPNQSIDKLASLLPPKGTIIDIGCGSGRDAKIFSEKGFTVTGIDFCPELLAIAKEHAPLATFKIMDIEELSFSESSFDGVWSACSLGHIPKNVLPEILMTINKILKKGGYFYLALKQGTGEGLEVDTRYKGDIKKYLSYYTAQELKVLLNNARFKILDIAHIEKNHSYVKHSALRVFCQK
ncbi:methyltransferase [Legionella busanensis]|uniref:Methyltransferase n=1 Tax=Legionella busanensis TaxID=190655 RepID=A0A378JLR0_9GAMM|nr:class I SAM-dependent methyltransferase [Legionella busanensis]STX52155.1 methyltransferase [Legionella busanensis]